MSYADVILGKVIPGESVAIIGAGGIGFDVAQFLSHERNQHVDTYQEFYNEWGIDISATQRGGLKSASVSLSSHKIYLLQRKTAKLGKSLGKTTGLIHRLSLKHKQVEMLAGVTYVCIDDAGLHISVAGKSRLLAVDSIIICAGQIEARALLQPLQQVENKVHLIGGAFKAMELDARSAIDQACRLAALL